MKHPAHEALTVRRFLEAGGEPLALRLVAGEDYLDRGIPEPALNRPGLALAGFFKYFAFRRIQVIGLAELAYLNSLGEDDQRKRLEAFFERSIPCLAITRNRQVPDPIHELANAYQTPVLRTPHITGRFINEATVLIERLLSPRIRVQGTMVDIMGIGVLLEGAPGVGKSETALGLIERGHSLVADDITILQRESAGRLIGQAVDLTRYHMEIRGLGIVHVPSLFGVASIRGEMRLDLIVHLHRPDPDIEDDRTGLAGQTREVLGVEVPVITLPVAAGRDMAQVVEVAALNQKLRRLGHDAAKELDEKLMSFMSETPRT